MDAERQPVFLIASNDPELLRIAEPALALMARVPVAMSAERALEFVRAERPELALLDERLPGMPAAQLIAAIQGDAEARRCAVMLIAQGECEEWLRRIEEGVVDDVIPLGTPQEYLRLRARLAVRALRDRRELEMLRESSALQAQHDPVTGVYSRSALLAQLFQETDRVQRMGTTLCGILFDIDDFGHWNAMLGENACADLLMQVARRVKRLLRSYDALGRMGNDEFLLALPGCSGTNAVLLAERIRTEVFAETYAVNGHNVRLSACFAVASSGGRSPVVLLRELDAALRAAKKAGPDTIRSSGDCPQARHAPAAFLSQVLGDDSLAW